MLDAPVVSNTSPLITLAGVGLLELLPQLYGEIWIPEVVRDEYLAHREPAHFDIQSRSWLRVHPTATHPTLQALSGFGAGEAAAISLAQASRARLVIVDDKRARRVAREWGLVVVGTLGVLVRARQQNELPAVRPVLDTMMAQGRHISPALREQTLRAVGESEQEER